MNDLLKFITTLFFHNKRNKNKIKKRLQSRLTSFDTLKYDFVRKTSELFYL